MNRGFNIVFGFTGGVIHVSVITKRRIFRVRRTPLISPVLQLWVRRSLPRPFPSSLRRRRRRKEEGKAYDLRIQ
ncbi:hypothetical protein KKD49_03465, partial [Myxococcota bacterium]|nr:hypothetical protein [Myxococcota bacterium]